MPSIVTTAMKMKLLIQNKHINPSFSLDSAERMYAAKVKNLVLGLPLDNMSLTRRIRTTMTSEILS